jgi:hypothetical protein
MTDTPPKPQTDKFRELARELEADEEPAHFEETLKKIATKTPGTGTKSPANSRTLRG